MTGINKRSDKPTGDQKKMTRYGTTQEQETADSNRLMKPALDAQRSRAGHEEMTRRSAREIRKRKLDYDIPHRDRAAKAAKSLLGRKK